MKLTLILLFCLATTAFALPKNIMKDDKDTFGTKKILFYKMLFGDGMVDLIMKEMTMEEKLVFDMLKVYNKHINPPGVTNLKFSISFLCAHVDRFTLKMTTRVLEKYMWKDMRLTWNPTEYNSITEIRFPAKKIWTPDMKLFNSVDGEEIRDEVNVVIRHDGTVHYIPLVTYTTNTLPTGTEGMFKGKLTIGSWAYDDKILKLTSDTRNILKDEYMDTCKHDITNVKVMVKDHTYTESPNQLYPALHIEFDITEKMGFMGMNFPHGHFDHRNRFERINKFDDEMGGGI